jgi:hypothetical protein
VKSVAKRLFGGLNSYKSITAREKFSKNPEVKKAIVGR